MRSIRKRAAALALPLLVLGLAAAAAPKPQTQAAVVVSGPPVAPAFGTPGQGLCAATKFANAADLPQQTAGFNAQMNALMDDASTPRVSATRRTVFDLSNNNPSLQQISYGDYRDAQLPTCGTGGCDFVPNDPAYNDVSKTFISRLRGYLNITSNMVNRPLHFGFYADDAISFTVFDAAGGAYPVIIRPPLLGTPTWRTTNTVRFNQAGLYPVELLYAQVANDAALEFSFLDGIFTDIEDAANNTSSLKAAGFTLFTADYFFQTETGANSFQDVDVCVQCNRQFAGANGNGGCGPSYYCNNAALCAPCTSTNYCGPSCAPCAGATPVCVNISGTYTCVQCNKNADCGNQVCDLSTHTCKECNQDTDCPSGKVCDVEAHECKQCNDNGQCGRGLSCVDHACTPCNTKDHCAGASCNCCPGGDTMKCEALAPGAAPTCVECVRDADCSDGKKCDTVNGHCVEKVAQCNTPDACGPSCARCPNDRPYCQDGQVCVECRNDLECGDGRFCVSGECTSCVTDRHCGPRCGTCGGDTPFCLSDGTTAHSACVRCIVDADCVGGTCDPTTHTCSATCAQSCGQGTVCDGQQCVQCYNNTHCPCGGSCENGTCVEACSDSSDCATNQHCSAAKTCEDGRVKPKTEPRGGGLCCAIAGPPTAGGILIAVVTVALLSRRKRAAV